MCVFAVAATSMYKDVCKTVHVGLICDIVLHRCGCLGGSNVFSGGS